MVAVKSINRNLQGRDASDIQKTSNEEAILKKLRHNNIVRFYEKLQAPVDNPTHDLYFMELCQGGDLLRYVRKRQKVEESVAKVLFKQIIIGIGYIHSEDILHRDIKLENILIDNSGTIKIADFGLSKMISGGAADQKKKKTGAVGTRAYWAPEVFKDQNYSAKSDIWAAGVVLYIMIYGMLPFAAAGDTAENIGSMVAQCHML